MTVFRYAYYVRHALLHKKVEMLRSQWESRDAKFFPQPLDRTKSDSSAQYLKSCRSVPISAADIMPWVDVTDSELVESGLQCELDSDHDKEEIVCNCAVFSSTFQHCIGWSLNGISLLATAVLSSLLDNDCSVTVASLQACLFPKVYGKRFLFDLFSPYVLPLMRHPFLASREGTVFTNSVVQLLFDSSATSGTSVEWVFVDTTDSTNCSVTQFMRSLREPFPDNLALSIAVCAAKSRDIAEIFKCVGMTAVNIGDAHLRTTAVQTLRKLIQFVHSGTSLALLKALLRTCPLSCLRGVLIDLAKEQTQRDQCGICHHEDICRWFVLDVDEDSGDGDGRHTGLGAVLCASQDEVLQDIDCILARVSLLRLLLLKRERATSHDSISGSFTSSGNLKHLVGELWKRISKWLASSESQFEDLDKHDPESGRGNCRNEGIVVVQQSCRTAVSMHDLMQLRLLESSLRFCVELLSKQM